MGRCSRKKYKTRFVLQLVFVKWVGFGLCFYLKCVDFYNFLAIKSGGVRKGIFIIFLRRAIAFGGDYGQLARLIPIVLLLFLRFRGKSCARHHREDIRQQIVPELRLVCYGCF